MHRTPTVQTPARRPWQLPCLALCLWALASPLPAQAHGGEDHGEHAPTAPAHPGLAPQRLPDGSLWVPKPAQRKLALRTVVSQAQAQAQAVELNGTVLPDPNAGGRVQAAQAGRIEAPPGGLPLLGQQVRRGQVLAYLRPLSNSLERGNQQAALAELDAQLALAERQLARYEQLEGAIAQKDIDAARIQRDALRQRRAAVAASVNAPEALTAPVTGVLASSHIVLGQVVEAREPLFDIVDPRRLMVEALVYDPAQVGSIGDASAPVAGGTVSLRFVGAGQALRDQAVPVLFRVTQSSSPLAIGQTLRLSARTTQQRQGVALPRAALVRQAGGATTVWLHDAPEHFSPRSVTSVPLDALRVLVTEGLEDGDRVVTDGASLLSQVR